MAQLTFRMRSHSSWVPDSYTGISTEPLVQVHPLDLVSVAAARVTTVFDGSNADAIVIVGDDGNTSRFIAAGEVDEHTAGVYIGAGPGIDNAFLYTVANTIDVVFTDDTGNDGSAGGIDWTFAVARVDI